MKPPTLMCSTSAGESTGTRAERYTVGTIEVGRREMIEQIESFSTASDHIPNAGKRSLAVMERLNYATARHPCLVGWRVGAWATAWGCGLFRFAPRWMASVAGAWAVGIGFTAFSLGIVMDGGARSGHLVGLATEG